MAAPTGRTTNLSLPYPLPDDDVDVPRDVTALATVLDNQYTPLENVPGAPYNGQLIRYQDDDMADLDAVWMLRYHQPSHRWIPEGGIPLYKDGVDVAVPSNTSPVPGATPLTLWLPRAGKYIIEYGYGIYSPVSTPQQAINVGMPQSVDLPVLFNGNAAAGPQPSQSMFWGIGNALGTGFARFEPGYSRDFKFTFNTGAQLLIMNYSTYNWTGSFQHPYLMATPIWLAGP